MFVSQLSVELANRDILRLSDNPVNTYFKFFRDNFHARKLKATFVPHPVLRGLRPLADVVKLETKHASKFLNHLVSLLRI